MASSRMIVYGVLIVALCFIATYAACNEGSHTARKTSLTMENRKMLLGMVLKNEKYQSVAARKNGNGAGVLNEELRMVPSGPDPLHHHGGGPKKPQTP